MCRFRFDGGLPNLLYTSNMSEYNRHNSGERGRVHSLVPVLRIVPAGHGRVQKHDGMLFFFVIKEFYISDSEAAAGMFAWLFFLALEFGRTL